MDSMTHPTFVAMDTVRHLIYIDDVIFVGTNYHTVLQHQLEYVRTIESVGLVVKRNKLCLPTSAPVKCLGMLVNGAANTVRLHPEAMARLLRDTFRLSSLSVCLFVWTCY